MRPPSIIQDQFGIIQNLQGSPIPQTSFLPWTFFAVSYSKTALACSLGLNVFIVLFFTECFKFHQIYFLIFALQYFVMADCFLQIPDSIVSMHSLQISHQSRACHQTHFYLFLQKCYFASYINNALVKKLQKFNQCWIRRKNVNLQNIPTLCGEQQSLTEQEEITKINARLRRPTKHTYSSWRMVFEQET